MTDHPTRRTVLAALAGVGPVAAALSPVGEFLDRVAPLSGSLWQRIGHPPETVESPYGPATVTYDDYHVPHVEADSEEAAAFAVGVAQAADRLGEMDLVRRRAGGRLAAVVGKQGLENDRFAAKMDFQGAAEASRRAIAGTDTESVVQAYADGVNTYIEEGPVGVEFGILGYEPEPWTVTDTALVGVLLGWFLTGSFETLRAEVKRDTFEEPTYRTLYPDRLDHDVPIVDPEETDGEVRGVGGDSATSGKAASNIDRDLVDWLSQFETPRIVGSNSWVVSGAVTDSGEPILCNDPHLGLQAPPIWYQQQVTIDGLTTRGGALVGTPLVVIGENDHGAWGLTNVGADVIDFYEYETREGEYRYRGEWLEFDTETRTIEVADGENEDVTVRKTVHGPYVDREIDGESRSVGVAWTGTSETREIEAIHGWNRSTGVESFRAATEKFDVPTQQLLYADRDGNTLYQMAGKIPIRRVEGDIVRGDRVFDGTAGEGEWEGFEPFGTSTWEGFVPFEEKPAVLNPTAISTANQRPADDPRYPIGQAYDSGFRATRIAERLDTLVSQGDVDREAMEALQTDALSVRARMLVPAILDARDRMPDAAGEWLDTLADWDYQMRPDSAAALFFRHVYDAFRERTWADFFEGTGLDETYWPQEWVLVTLPADSDVFDGDRAGVLTEAVEAAVETIDEEGWENYGEYNVTAIDHPFGEQVPGLNYDRHPTSGTGETVWAFDTESDHGASYRLVADIGGKSRDVIPGGNDGSPFGDSYQDQLPLWARGEYRRLDGEPDGGADITVEEAEE